MMDYYHRLNHFLYLAQAHTFFKLPLLSWNGKGDPKYQCDPFFDQLVHNFLIVRTINQ